MSHPNFPFMATSVLLLLWGTGRYDSDVTFLGVILTCSYLLVEALSATTHNTNAFGIVIPEMDMFSPYFVNDQKSLSYFLLMGFCFAFGAVGTALFAFSPFCGTVLYTVVVSALFRDVSVIGDARVVVWACVILSGALSEHIFRLNLAALVFAGLVLEKGLREQPGAIKGHGTLESASFLAGLLFLTAHDMTVRFLLEPIKAIVHAGFLGLSAFVMVDSALEFGALPASNRLPESVFTNKLWSSKWTDCLHTQGLSFDLQRFPQRLIQAAPVLACLFSAAYLYRILRINRRSMDWVRWQQLTGVGVGTAIGLQFWARYGGLESFDSTSPLAVCWVFTSILFCASTIFSGAAGQVVPLTSTTPSATSESSSTSLFWHTTYWKGKASKSTSKKTTGHVKTPYPTLLLGSFSATYPEIYDIAKQLEETHYSLQAALTRRTQALSFENAKQSFACNSLVNTLVKHTEDLSTKLSERIAIIEKQYDLFARIDGNDPSSSSMSQKSKQRLIQLSQDYTAINSYAEQLRSELAKRDDETLRVLEQTFNDAKTTMTKITASLPNDNHMSELTNKRQLDELDQMCEAIRRRIKHRKKKVETVTVPIPTNSISAANTPLPPSSSANSSANGSPTNGGNVALPVLEPGQSTLYPSNSADRETGSVSPSKSSPGRRSRTFFPFYRSKKSSSAQGVASPVAAAAAAAELADVDRQSASSAGRSGSSKRWSFMNRSSSKKQPSTEAPAASPTTPVSG